MTSLRCVCCDEILSRGGAIPEARWIRIGDRYCKGCKWLFSREVFEAGLLPRAINCPEHGTAPAKRAVPILFEED